MIRRTKYLFLTLVVAGLAVVAPHPAFAYCTVYDEFPPQSGCTFGCGVPAVLYQTPSGTCAPTGCTPGNTSSSFAPIPGGTAFGENGGFVLNIWCTYTPDAPLCAIDAGLPCTASDACGTNTGTYQCDGTCSVAAPTIPAGFGNSCSSAANSCGTTNTGIVGCFGFCSVLAAPPNPAYLGQACNSPANACGSTNPGVYMCGGICSASAPANPAYLGQACTSAANSCGMTNTGTYQCGGSCSAATPSNALCTHACAPTDACQANTYINQSCTDGACTYTGTKCTPTDACQANTPVGSTCTDSGCTYNGTKASACSPTDACQANTCSTSSCTDGTCTYTGTKDCSGPEVSQINSFTSSLQCTGNQVGNVSLSWSTTELSSCEMEREVSHVDTNMGPNFDQPNGTNVQDSTPATGPTDYLLTCYVGAFGNGTPFFDQTAVVTNTCVANPTVSLTASPTRVVQNGNTTLTWSSTSATSCTMTRNGTDMGGSFDATTSPADGIEDPTPIKSQTVYVLNCNGTTAKAVVNTIPVYSEF